MSVRAAPPVFFISGRDPLLDRLRRSAPALARLRDEGPPSRACLVGPGNRSALAQALRRLIEEPGLRTRLGENARQTFARRFAPDVFAAELGAL